MQNYNIMASSSETGHNKNVANFDSAYQILEEMGALYTISNPNLFLVNLQPKKVSLGTTIKILNDKKPKKVNPDTAEVETISTS